MKSTAHSQRTNHQTEMFDDYTRDLDSLGSVINYRIPMKTINIKNQLPCKQSMRKASVQYSHIVYNSIQYIVI